MTGPRRDAVIAPAKHVQGKVPPMEFGVFHEFPSLIGRPDSEAFAEAFDIVDGAERWGLDVMWLAELHFDPSRSILSSPMCVASAIAARTSRMKIGIGVQVLPLGNPLRIAEEAATVDQISGGKDILNAEGAQFSIVSRVHFVTSLSHPFHL